MGQETAAPRPSEAAHGRLLAGRYRVERLLGEGGMGAVYQVCDQSTGQRLALKRLHAAQSERTALLFEREYRTLAGIHHPRIVEVFEYGLDADGPYYTMELLEGGDLSKRAPLSFRATCACLRDAASILGVLHSRRLVHRDLSPRNLWQTCDGRLKLLDFGTLAPFGPAAEVVGTPCFVPPEALAGKSLDQRCDLFALGALGYWLLTGAHAFRATRLAELPRVWAKPPAPPSSYARLNPEADQDIPSELDRLIEALLRLEPDERPRNTAEVIDRLNAIAGLTPEAEDVVVTGYLESKLFVGRERERDRCARALSQANLGVPGALCVEGPEGIGRSRLLTELALVAGLTGATVIAASSGATGRPYETALTLARNLLQALPHEARLAAKPHAALLVGLLPEARELLGNPSRSAPVLGAAEERVLRQSALAGWLLTVARERTLALFVDDLHAVDEESQALLAVLARAEPGHRLLLVCSVDSDSPLSQQLAVRSYGAVARKLRLPALTASQMQEMLRSVFGEVPYLERLAARLHQLSDGSPSHAWLLARHLVRSGAIRYAEGAWTLPTDLPVDLPTTLKGSLVAALETLPLDARRVARLLSVHPHGALTRAMLSELATPSPIDQAVALLLEQHLVRESDEGLRLAHPALGEVLGPELEATERARIHRLLGELFAQQAGLLSQVHSGLHMLLSGELESGDRQLLAASRRIMAGEHDCLHAAAPLFAEALTLVRRAGRGDHAQVPLLNVLAVAGYQVDRSYAARYGDDALAGLQRILRFDLTRRLRPWLGGLLSLLVALAFAALGMRRQRMGARPLEVITWLFTVLGYLMGPAAMSLDQQRLRAYAKVFEPLLSLGREHGLAMVHRFCLALVVSLEDRSADAQRALGSLIARLGAPGPIRSLPEANRRNLLCAAYYTFATRETFACDPHLLVSAAVLAEGSPMHSLQADQLRAIHHSYAGDFTLADSYNQRVELLAIQLGTAWQAELVAPRHLARIAFWTHDVATHKRALRALGQLAREFPSFEVAVRRARGTDLVLRGRYQEALLQLEVAEEPRAELGWASARAQLAMAYNGLGQHERARAVCRDVLSRLSEGDAEFVIQNLPAEVELAHAEAALADRNSADGQLAALLQRHRDKGPLILGYLHRARARMALLAGELSAADAHLTSMEACYRPTRIPSLLVLCMELRQELSRARNPEPSLASPLTVDDAHLLTRVELILRTSSDNQNSGPAHAALQVALELTGADRGVILYADDASEPVTMGTPAGAELTDWARAELSAAEDEGDRTATLWDEVLSEEQRTERALDGVSYSLSVLWRAFGDTERPVAALLLGSKRGTPIAPPTAVLRLIGERLARAAA